MALGPALMPPAASLSASLPPPRDGAAGGDALGALEGGDLAGSFAGIARMQGSSGPVRATATALARSSDRPPRAVLAQRDSAAAAAAASAGAGAAWAGLGGAAAGGRAGGAGGSSSRRRSPSPQPRHPTPVRRSVGDPSVDGGSVEADVGSSSSSGAGLPPRRSRHSSPAPRGAGGGSGGGGGSISGGSISGGSISGGSGASAAPRRSRSRPPSPAGPPLETPAQLREQYAWALQRRAVTPPPRRPALERSGSAELGAAATSVQLQASLRPGAAAGVGPGVSGSTYGVGGGFSGRGIVGNGSSGGSAAVLRSHGLGSSANFGADVVSSRVHASGLYSRPGAAASAHRPRARPASADPALQVPPTAASLRASWGGQELSADTQRAVASTGRRRAPSPAPRPRPRWK